MRSSEKKRKRQKTVQITIMILVVTVAAVLAGAFYLWNQARKMSRMDSGGEVVRDAAEAETDTVEAGGSVYKYNDHLSNYLFMGIDTRDEVSSYESQQDAGQADAIFLVSMDRATEEIKVLLIPRDTIAEIEVFNPSGKSLGTTEDHINIQYAYGDGKEKSCELMKTAVSNLLGDIPIRGYCAMNMDGISVITDFVGGVEVTVPDSSLEEVNPDFTEGAVVTLTGDNAEQFVRYRDTEISQSAIVRQERQKVYLQAFLKKAQAMAEDDASFAVDIFNEIQPFTVTNLGNDIFAKLLTASQGKKVETSTIPGEAAKGENFDEYHVDQQQLDRLLLSMFYSKQV